MTAIPMFMKLDAHIHSHSLFRGRASSVKLTVSINISSIEDIHDGSLDVSEYNPESKHIEPVTRSGAIVCTNHGHMGSSGATGHAATVVYIVPGVTTEQLTAKIERRVKEILDYARIGPMPVPEPEKPAKK